ncbi:MAG: aromatic-L-amino-acid decarboxylase [Paracoccaceae bacterium]|jgi:aromatic-L-amino-acid decarboxylase
MGEEGRRLDPADWDGFRAETARLLSDCLDRLEGARDLPWVAPPAGMRQTIGLGGAVEGLPMPEVFDRMRHEIMPYATGNTHPGFFGWVHGTGAPIGVAAEMVAATMNANCGGRDHGAMQVEAAVIDWVTGLAGMSDDAFGLLTSGTSQATLLALAAARVRLFGVDVRKSGIRGLPEVAVYAATGAHACVGRALEVLGHGRDALRLVPVRGAAGMDMDALAQMVARDVAAGVRPLAVVATAGSVNTGVFDPIDRIADYCAAQGIWLHVDAAFGFWTLLADDPWCDLVRGIGRAQSIALDFHKWMSVPYECGACLISDRALHRATFADRPDYLASGSEGLAGGTPWFTDYGIELSRGFRALKVWATVMAIGTRALGAAVSDNCRQARLMRDLVAESPVLTLAHPVVSNLCCFYPNQGDPEQIAAQLQRDGDSVFSTTRIDGRSCLRAAIVNHRTTSDDIRNAIAAVEAHLK